MSVAEVPIVNKDTVIAYRSILTDSNIISVSFDIKNWIKVRSTLDDAMTANFLRFAKNHQDIKTSMEIFPKFLLHRGLKVYGWQKKVQEVFKIDESHLLRNLVSSDIRFVYFEVGDKAYSVVQVADNPLGIFGYSDPFVINYSETGNWKNTLYGYRCGILSSEGRHSWATDNGGINWHPINEITLNLEEFNISDKIEDKGKGKLVVIGDNLYCPLSGYRLYPINRF